jgi:hypothetical protein
LASVKGRFPKTGSVNGIRHEGQFWYALAKPYIPIAKEWLERPLFSIGINKYLPAEKYPLSVKNYSLQKSREFEFESLGIYDSGRDWCQTLPQ